MIILRLYKCNTLIPSLLEKLQFIINILMNLTSQVTFDKAQDLKHVEFRCNQRKVVVENIDQFEPLSKYIDAEKLHELMTLSLEDQHKSEQGIHLNSNIVLYDFSHQQGRPATGVGISRKNVISRAYSAFTKKKK
ncbi:hypothetical protein pb186bvf_018617 [Paramecium bursaria]